MRDSVERLSRYPFARIRVVCRPCNRSGSYGLARLAERHGADLPLADLLLLLTASCRWQRRPGDRPPRPYEPRCLACFPDLEGSSPPATTKPRLRLVQGGR